MGGSDCHFGSVGVLDGTTFCLFGAFPAIVITHGKVIRNGIEIVGLLWLEWFLVSDAAMSCLLTVGTESKAVDAMHLICPVSANMLMIATKPAGEGRHPRDDLCSSRCRSRMLTL